MAAIYNGLGIPPTLTGAGGTGTTNNYISLKTLLQRLQYARKTLLAFWNQEIAEVQQAMGFRFPAKIEFDIDILDDEHATKSLLVQLVDRSLISEELLQLRFGHDPEMENIRLNREQRARDNGNKLNKAGPFHDPQFGLALKKIALQTGAFTPSQVGLTEDSNIFDLKINKKKTGEKSILEMRQLTTSPNASKTSTKKGIPQQGRPKTSKDTTQRKTKTFSPKVRANVEIWLQNAQASISDTLNDIFLTKFNKRNMRMLTNGEIKLMEKVKFGVLFNLEPLSSVTAQCIMDALKNNIDDSIYSTYQSYACNISKKLDRPLTSDELKQLQITLYSSLYIEA